MPKSEREFIKGIPIKEYRLQYVRKNKILFNLRNLIQTQKNRIKFWYDKYANALLDGEDPMLYNLYRTKMHEHEYKKELLEKRLVEAKLQNAK